MEQTITATVPLDIQNCLSQVFVKCRTQGLKNHKAIKTKLFGEGGREGSREQRTGNSAQRQTSASTQQALGLVPTVSQQNSEAERHRECV